MKLCFVGSAASYHVSKWVAFFGRRGHEVHIVSTSQAEIEGVQVHYLPNPATKPVLRHMYYWTYRRAVKRIMRAVQPDVVHGLQINIYSTLASGVCACPIVITPFGGDVLINPKRSLLARYYARTTLRRADLVVCDADHIKPALYRFGADPARTHVIYFGVDVERYKPMNPDAELRARLGLGSGPTIISLRHLMPVYDIDTLLRAAQLVVARVPEAKFLIIGTGPESERLRRLAAEFGITENACFAGWVDGSDLPRYLNLSDIYVSTSLSDAGLASSTAEAMACQVAPVITDFGDNGSWVRDGVDGYLFPLKDHACLAERLIDLLLCPSRRRKFAELARNMIVERYNWSTEMERMERLYASLAGRRRAL